MANLPLVKWRTKKMGVLLLLALQQSIFVKCEVVTIEDQMELDLVESDDPTGSVLDDTGLLSVSDNCSDYGIDDLPHPRIILLGPTGVGKSTLANQLLGRNPLNKSEQVFSIGHGAESHTMEITYVVGNWLGDGSCFTIIDTPGASDSEGRDYQHALAMANIMKDQIKSVDVFLLCFNGGVSRFDQSTIDLLKLYESIFSKQMWNHAVTEVTYWAHDKKSVWKRRKHKNLDEKIRHKQWNSQYKQELGVTIDIPSVYIDPVLAIFDDEGAEFLDVEETEAFKKYTDELFEYGNNSEPFFCDGNCQAPNGYFLGNPWIETDNITIGQGEKAVIKCQIWNGIKGIDYDNVIWTHNGEIIFEKNITKNMTEPLVNTTDVWGSNVKFEEILSPGEGHYTDFIIEFHSLEESMEGEYTCENDKNTDAAEVYMKVDGLWGEWGPWGKCSISCLSKDGQMGHKKRVREAVSPRNGGNSVNPLDAEDTQICAGEQGPDNPIQCLIDFAWNSWTEWSQCSPRCGEGTSYRMRFCNQGSHGGKMCPLSIGNNLSQKQEKDCKIKDCPDCILLGWQEWSACSKTCMGFRSEAGTRTRQRNTKEADPNNPECNPDDHSQREICNAFPCPVDGGWTGWSPWSSCSATCSNNHSPTQFRTRSCTQPPALYGGNQCEGSPHEIKDCNNHKCYYEETGQIYLDGGYWGNWGSKETCTFPHFVTAMNLKVESNQRGGDDSALNAVRLTCSDGKQISSRQSGWGYWRGETSCSGGHYIKTAKIRRESYQGKGRDDDGQGRRGDDSAANGIRFWCTNGRKHYPSDGYWGQYLSARSCPAGSAVMGIKTQVEPNQGGRGDDSALNDVILYCAKLLSCHQIYW